MVRFCCVQAGECSTPRPLRSGLFAFRARRSGPCFRVAAFTLLELLITIALIGLLASVLIVGSTRLLSEQPVTPEDIFRKAVSEARKFAVENNTEVRLGYSVKDKAFTASANGGNRLYPVNGPDDLAFSFLSAQKGGGAIMISGTVLETQTVPFVNFYPDGTCTPFRIQIQLNGNVRAIAFDPWTCAPVLESNPTVP